MDVAIVGDGLIALSVANALGARGLRCVVLGRRRPGFASAAAAGLLAPTIEAAAEPALAFALAARERYRTFVPELEALTHAQIALDLGGILRLPANDAEQESLEREVGPRARWLSTGDVRELEPALQAPRGALLHFQDGIVDNVAMLAALETAVATRGVQRRVADALTVELRSRDVRIFTDDGEPVSCSEVVIAGGAWSATIEGLPLPLPVTPLRGQMLSLEGAPVRRPVYGFGGYIAPRAAGYTIVGSTSEDVGFATGTTESALARFREVARTMARPFADARRRSAWSGLRPMTPDGLPIIGRDPGDGRVIYACGHSRNGILLAPITGDVVADILDGSQSTIDLTPFSIERFQANSSQRHNRSNRQK